MLDTQPPAFTARRDTSFWNEGHPRNANHFFEASFVSSGQSVCGNDLSSTYWISFPVFDATATVQHMQWYNNRHMPASISCRGSNRESTFPIWAPD